MSSPAMGAAPRGKRTPAFASARTSRLLLVLAGLLAIGACFRLMVSFGNITNPLELDNAEGLVLMQARHITDFNFAYRNIDTPPYVAFAYPPIYYFIVRLVLPLTGDWLSAGRLTSVLASLAIAALFGFLIHRVLPRTVQPLPRFALTAVAALIPFHLETIAWTSFMRVDTVAFLFAFAGLITFILSTRMGPQLLATAFFVAAFYSKQSTAAAAMACLALSAVISIRRTLVLAAFGAALALAFGGIWNIWTDGGFVLNLVRYTFKNPFSAFRALNIATKNFYSLGLLLPLSFALAAMVLAKYARGGWRPAIKRMRASLRVVSMRRAILICAVHFWFSLGLTPSVGKLGSNYNYFLEWNLSCCLMACFLLAIWFGLPGPARDGARRSSWGVAIASVLILCAALPPMRIMQNLPLTSARRAEVVKSRQDASRIVEQIRAAPPGPVLSDNLAMIQQAGKEVFAELDVLNYMSRAGAWDQSDFVAMIRQAKFPLIVAQFLDDDKLYTPQVRQAVRERYRLSENIAGYAIYRP